MDVCPLDIRSVVHLSPAKSTQAPHSPIEVVSPPWAGPKAARHRSTHSRYKPESESLKMMAPTLLDALMSDDLRARLRVHLRGETPLAERDNDVDVGPCWKQHLPLRGVDLRGESLRGQGLYGVDLRDTDLRGADLSKADCQWADFRGSDLRGANLTDADLRHSDLRGADLREIEYSIGTRFHPSICDRHTRWPDTVQNWQIGPGCSLYSADFSRLDLSGEDLRNAKLTRCNMRRTNLRQVRLSGADLTEAVIARSRLDEARLVRVNLSNACVEESHFTKVNAQYAKLVSMSASNTFWEGADLTEADLTDSRLSHADLRRATLRGAVLRRVQLLGSDLRETELEGSDFELALYDQHTKWPQETPPLGARFVGPGAVVSELDLSGVRLRNIRLERVQLRDSQMTECKLTNVELHRVGLQGTSLEKARLHDVQLKHCNFEQANFDHTNWVDSTIETCSFVGASLQGAQMGRYGSKMSVRGARFCEAHLERAYLIGDWIDVNFQNAVLDQADLTRCSLYNTDFRGAQLVATNLSGAKLQGCRLEGANVSLAVFRKTTLIDVTLQGAILFRTDFRGTDLRRVNLVGVDLSRAVADALTQWPDAPANAYHLVPGSDLQGAELVGLWAENATLSSSNLSNAMLDHAILRGADLAGADLRNATLQNADLSRADLSGADLRGATLEGTRLDGANLTEANLEGLDLSTATLRLARVSGAHLEGVTWNDEQRLQVRGLCEPPTGPLAVLVHLQPDGTEQYHVLQEDRFMVGRARNNELSITHDSKISRYHFCIHKEEDKHFVEDATSCSGTFVNGEGITRYRLYSGAEIRAGDSLFRFVVMP